MQHLREQRERFFRLLLSLTLPLFVGAIGSLSTTSQIDTWYVTLQKPAWNPPSWLFGPVWALLYLSMGVALYFVWSAPSSRRKTISLFLFAVQLLLNGAWSIIFFGYHQIFFALIEMFFLLGSVIITIMLFSRIRFIAATLLIPYGLWVTFATVLTYTIWIANR